MKLLYKYSLIIASLFFLLSCDKETEDISRITYYCELDLKGGAVEFVSLGGTYAESGWVATEDGKDVSDKVTVLGKDKINTQVAGLYRLDYSVNNSDGYPTSVSRNVAVVAALPTTDLSGEYQIVPTTRENKITIAKVGGILGYYHATDTWYQTYAIPADFVDMGDGTLKVLSGSSPYGPHYGTGKILANGQIQFTVTLANQGPRTYTTTYQLQ
jgi:hypothetical protein